MVYIGGASPLLKGINRLRLVLDILQEDSDLCRGILKKSKHISQVGLANSEERWMFVGDDIWRRFGMAK